VVPDGRGGVKAPLQTKWVGLSLTVAAGAEKEGAPLLAACIGTTAQPDPSSPPPQLPGLSSASGEGSRACPWPCGHETRHGAAVRAEPEAGFPWMLRQTGCPSLVHSEIQLRKGLGLLWHRRCRNHKSYPACLGAGRSRQRVKPHEDFARSWGCCPEPAENGSSKCLRLRPTSFSGEATVPHTDQL